MYYIPVEIDDSLFYMDDFLYRLDIPRYEIDDRTRYFLQCLDRMQEEHLSLRQLTRETGIPKSTMQDFIHNELGSICLELKSIVLNQIRWNKRNNYTFMKRYKI